MPTPRTGTDTFTQAVFLSHSAKGKAVVRAPLPLRFEWGGPG